MTRINNSVLYVNPDLIEFLEETPDTIISMTTGKKLVVIEPINEINNRIVEFKRKINTQLPEVIAQQE